MQLIIHAHFSLQQKPGQAHFWVIKIQYRKFEWRKFTARRFVESTYFTSPLGQEYSQQELQIRNSQNFLLKCILNQWPSAKSIPPEHQTGVYTIVPTRCPHSTDYCDHIEVSMYENNVHGMSYHTPGHIPNT